MDDQPHLTHGLERARLLVHENRLAEVSFDDLSAADRMLVEGLLREKLHRARRRVVRAHLRGVALTAAFLTLGLFLLGIGPAIHVRFFSNMPFDTMEVEGVLWAALLAVAILGAGTADYFLRHRLKVARMWETEARAIGRALKRASA